jgi:hypothetical protein
MVVLKIVSQELFAQAGFQITILLISAFGVARITGMSHYCPPPPKYDIFVCLR